MPPGFEPDPNQPAAPGPFVMGAPPPQPPKSSKAPLIMVLVLFIVLVLGVGTVFFLINDKDPQTTTTASDKNGPSSSATSDTESSKSEPEPSESTTEPDPGSGTSMSESDYGDWNYKMGDFKLSADKIDGWDYEDCSSVESDGALTDLGCESALEVAYETEDGDMRLSMLMFMMSDADAATKAADGEIDETDYRLHKGSYIKDFDYGKQRTGSSSEIVVLVVATATANVAEADADEYLSTLFLDHKLALEFRVE